MRQIDNEEYGEALSLAHAYNLDSDLVYQRQWRKSTVSIASIQDYLVRGKAGDEAAIDRRVKMSQEAEEEGREMKHCSSLAVYPTLLDVVCVCMSLSRGEGGLRCSPLPPYSISRIIFTNLWHISDSFQLPNSASRSVPPLSSHTKKETASTLFVTANQSKICKRSWVLHECVERVPENVDAAKELLQYGLKGTDLEALIAIGNREDGGR